MPFNKEQQAAIDARGKTILVSAPAGSGKTRILVSRMDSLIKNDGYDMHAFLVLTFTDAAGQEMKQRLNIQLHEDLHDPSLTESQRAHILTCIEQLPHAYMTTFDSFCKSLLEKYG
jgi:ATP-dependent exoDNAse (exonuclease V) beta subunit